MAKSEDDMKREKEERQINEEYKIWKKNTPFLYDQIGTLPLQWPSLTVEWLPVRQTPAEKDYYKQKLIIGTHTAEDERNYLMVALAQLPTENAEYKVSHYHDNRSDFGGFGYPNSKVQIVQRINHDGEVNRARNMPQNPYVIATKTISGEVYIFHCSRHPNEPPSHGKCIPDLRLKGHKTEGYGLSWNKFKRGHLLSGSEDAQICLWDVNATSRSTKTLDPMQVFKIHEGCVEDVAWHMKHEHLFGSVGEDKYLHIWDLRSPTVNKPIQSIMAHQSEVNSLAFNPLNEWMLATGSVDKTVKLFDLRKLKTSLHTFESHKEDVIRVGWSPKNETVLASCSFDRRLMIWDVSRIGMEQTAKDAKDGPPELMFIHGGHTSQVSDFSWNPSEDWVIASVASNNILQIWQMAESIYHDEYDDDDGLADLRIDQLNLNANKRNTNK